MRRLTFAELVAAVPAILALSLLGQNGGPVQANASNLDVHVHETYFHPADAFLIDGSTDHALARAACEKFDPDAQCDAQVQVGDTVTWLTDPLAQLPHTITECIDTFDNCGAGTDPVGPIGDSEVKQPGTWQYGPVQFDTPGTFYYICRVHPGLMRGRVVVNAEASPTPGGSSSSAPTPLPAASPTSSPAPSQTQTPAPSATPMPAGISPTPSPIATGTPAALPASGGSPAQSGASIPSILLAVTFNLLVVGLSSLFLRGLRQR